MGDELLKIQQEREKDVFKIQQESGTEMMEDKKKNDEKKNDEKKRLVGMGQRGGGGGGGGGSGGAMIALKTEIFLRKARQRSGETSGRSKEEEGFLRGRSVMRREKLMMEAKNKGVATRNAEDRKRNARTSLSSMKDDEIGDVVNAKLEEKAKTYERLLSGCDNGLTDDNGAAARIMVDFVRKRYNNTFSTNVDDAHRHVDGYKSDDAQRESQNKRIRLTADGSYAYERHHHDPTQQHAHETTTGT